MYKCRFCRKLMKQHNGWKNIKKDEFHLGTVTFWSCEDCGVYVQEFTINYDKEQMKEINKNFSDKPIEEELNKW